ncbi:MAG: DHHW family protein [Eubacteriales bacterium]|nr:DHHW family protein [Eubacteriales bacterium]
MMNQNRMKRLVLLVSALAMAAQLSACSSGAPAETTPKASESGTQPTTPPETSSTQPGGTIADITVAPPETSGLPVVIDTTSDTPVSVFETTTGVQTSGQDTQNVDTTPIDTGAVLVIGNSAMEHYYGVDSALESYAGTVSSIKQQLPDVNVYAMFCPSAVEFCAPAKYQAGTRSQQRAMNVIYNALQNGAVGVDTWSELNQHSSEYLYFRTDHHWTQRGAYYAYVAFCKAAGFTPHDLSEYETGIVENFVGTMSIYAKDYASRFYNNPDSVEYFRPINPSTMTVYSTPAMTNGSPRAVVASQESADKMSRGAKYSMFISGDNPISHIVSDTIKNGRVCIVTKESYGNALVPFLTDHFEEIYVIDPRQFNTDGKPSLNLISFAKEHGATDVVCVNAAVLLPGINKYLKKMI